MAKRSYQQYCGLAAALDVVGERWALLLVRDLAPGPRRFTDLFNGLPGISTDMLADRLRSLEAAGAVELTEIRHPVPAKVYGLTDRGRKLARIAGDLADWGMPLLPAPTSPAGASFRKDPRWALQTMALHYRGGLNGGEYRFTVGDDALRVDVDAEGATVGYGHGSGTPELAVRCSERSFYTMVRTGRAGEGVHIEHGTVAQLNRAIRALPLESSD
jgi:DNA-binding HxlR family transcriptional regulator